MTTINGTKGELVNLINGLFAVQTLKGKRFSLIVSKNIAILQKSLKDVEEAGKPSEEFMALATQVNEIANQAVIRPQDQEYIQGLADNMMLEISENVKGYGGYSKFMLSGGWKQIRDYKKTMLESEEFVRLKTNAANYTKLQELKDENPHQIYQ